MSQRFYPNVIVFGETGVGKSSVINMILGSDKAKVGHGLLGQTFESTVYPVEIDGTTYNLYDTAGLGEYSGGTVDNSKAVRNLYRLVTDLSKSGGVNLLVFVFKCGRRITETMHKNYNLFYHGFCDSQVPIAIVVTGCENVEPNMDRWWIDNEQSFTQAGMKFNGSACVCAFKGRKTNAGGYRNEGLVRESVDVIKCLVVQHCTTSGWSKIIGSIVNQFRSSKIPVIYTNLNNRLTNVHSKSEAEVIIEGQPILNVVIFGEMGAGKSSIINTILGSDMTSAVNRVGGKALENTVEIKGKTYLLHDTVGLGEHSGMNGAEIVGKIYRLLTHLSDNGGVNLLIFVVRRNTPFETMRKYYSLLHRGLCDSKVPIVIVVTGFESVRPNGDPWWTKNEGSLTEAGMSFDGHACVRTPKEGKTNTGHCHDENLVKESVGVLRELVVRCCMLTGWENRPVDSFRLRVLNFFCRPKIPDGYMSLHARLRNISSSREAEDVIKAITKHHAPARGNTL